jgi:hypothetical protein
MNPHCNGPCDQGRKPCPAPDACERVCTDDDGINTLGAVFIAVLACAVIALLVA